MSVKRNILYCYIIRQIDCVYTYIKHLTPTYALETLQNIRIRILLIFLQNQVRTTVGRVLMIPRTIRYNSSNLSVFRNQYDTKGMAVELIGVCLRYLRRLADEKALGSDKRRFRLSSVVCHDLNLEVRLCTFLLELLKRFISFIITNCDNRCVYMCSMQTYTKSMLLYNPNL